MEIKMIVSDLDSTLLRTNKTISAYTADVLHQCRAQGIKIAFATARTENACRRFIEMVHPDVLISNGGAVVRVGDQVVTRAVISIETTNALLSKLLKTPSAGYITTETDNGNYVNKPVDENDPGWLEYLPAYLIDFTKGLSCVAYKISAEILDENAAYDIASAFPEVKVITFSGESWYDFTDKAASKWNGVKAAADHIGIDTQSVAAFGDDFNDIEMLKHCGTGVAMANAINEAKAAADFVCDTNDNDGVAKWIKRYVLMED